ncbi:MAG TPA: hypothetical protein VFE74_05410 [Ramlibacter sp.]|nr:hypothetical protein [Ramlibacter sp.]
MKDGKPTIEVADARRRRGSAGQRAPPPRRRSQEGARGPEVRDEPGYIERATARGHSGHGVESVRPHLRDQLRLKALMATPFSPEPDYDKDEHHR